MSTSNNRSFTLRLATKLGNPIEWTYLNKALLFFLLYVIANGTLTIALELALANGRDELAFLHAGNLRLLLNAQWLFILGLLCASGLALILRIYRPDSSGILYFAGAPMVLHDAVLAHVLGWATFPGIWMLPTVTVIAMVWFFDNIAVLMAIVVWGGVHVIFIFGERFGLMTYAPLFEGMPFSKAGVEPAWGVMTTIFGSFVFILTMVVFTYSLRSWRHSEARVRELSQLLQQTFGRYLSPEVMATILEDPNTLSLGGQRRRITMLMSDLRGFTPICERLAPEQIVKLLNRYLGVMLPLCRTYHGTVNDIIGDALLVTFGAPVTRALHADDAVACAIAMQNAMAAINAENLRDGLPELAMGIGLNTDEVVVGNIGTEERSKFGIIGTGVNLTSRIESYTVGGQILAAESVREAVEAELRIDARHDIHPKGIERGFAVYEIGGIGGDYQLVLQQMDIVLHEPMKPVTVHWTYLDGAPDNGPKVSGQFVRLSTKSAELAPADLLRPNDNIRVILAGVPAQLAQVAIYAKVMSVTDDKALLRFTAVPVEAACYFSGVLRRS